MSFRAGLRKLGPKNNIPEVFLTRKAKKKNYYYYGEELPLRVLFPLGLSNTQKSRLRVAASPVSVSTISLRQRE